jgi:hypothetical protein
VLPPAPLLPLVALPVLLVALLVIAPPLVVVLPLALAAPAPPHAAVPNSATMPSVPGTPDLFLTLFLSSRRLRGSARDARSEARPSIFAATNARGMTNLHAVDPRAISCMIQAPWRGRCLEHE